MSIWDKQHRVCGTCIHWKGKRRVNFGHIEVQCEEGNCKKPDGCYNMKTMQGYSCSKWRGFSPGDIKAQS
ncbi:hypothetical protein [Clostridium ganghwense]|uniref:Uncharacterized protein n=1 Tax=Clostridium ganghwense TaxID=312089 RepID=A0ABT4CMJ0_9CLOT|nr:hypothetical protein [Clostridium ganghwense]MCY6370260.1 hypothetical protein [Clostridium ganghwense]